MNKQQSVILVFVLVAIGNLIGAITGNETISVATKPLLVPLLIYYYFISTNVRSMPLLIALVFCWLGDVALMFTSRGEIYFMLGLGAFLVGHVFFILTYRQLRWESTGNDMSIGMMIRFSALLMMPGIVLIVLLYPSLGGLKFPVMLYALAITAMVKFAFYRFQRTSPLSFWLVFCGSLIFMASDSLIAINKFISPIENSGLLIMSTYITAQLLIVYGLIKHFETK